MRVLRWILLAPVLGAGLSLAAAARAGRVPPVDRPYPGQLAVRVDLTDAPRKIFHVHETVPVRAGPLTLYYPQWIPGEHAPSGPVENVTGLVITAGGRRLAWRRDLRDMYAVHVGVPAGADRIELAFEFLSPADGGMFGASPSATPELVDLEFNQVAFYPAGYYARQVRIQPTVVLPHGWQFATALDPVRRDRDSVVFQPLSFEELVDSPLIAGRHFRRIDLHGRVPVHLDMVADRPGQLAIDARQIAGQRAVIEQAGKLFAGQPYRHYDFLLTLSDHTGHFGLEHRQSSDDRLPPAMLADPRAYLLMASLMPHEYVHAWCGKFRRPASLWAPDFNSPEEGDLLWVYEGLTEYWSGLLTVRAGLWTPAQYRDALASVAAAMGARAGRSWRSLQDTADAAPMAFYGGMGWRNWRRGADFYAEGQLLWLDVDTTIRTLSHGRRSLDDLARDFFGAGDGDTATRTFRFDDLLAALQRIQPYDWRRFLRERLDYVGDRLPEHGIERAGWKLVYTDRPNSQERAAAALRGNASLVYSLGLAATGKGRIYDVQWGGPAFRAGLVPGLELVAVNGRDFSVGALEQAVRDAAGGTAPIALLVRNQDLYSTVRVDYHGGLKYPHLVRAAGADLIGDIVAPRR